MQEIHTSNCDIEQSTIIIASLIANEDKMPNSLRSALLFMVSTNMNLLGEQALLIEKLHTAYFAERERRKPCKY